MYQLLEAIITVMMKQCYHVHTLQMRMLGDSAYDTLEWHDHLLGAGVVPVAPYDTRNTDDPKDIEYRVEDRITDHSEDIQLKQSTLDETYNRRSGVERANDSD